MKTVVDVCVICISVSCTLRTPYVGNPPIFSRRHRLRISSSLSAVCIRYLGMLSAISIIKPAFPPPSLSSYVGILEQSPTFRFRNHCLHQAHPWLMDRADGRRRQFLRVGAKPPDSVYRTLSGDLNVGEEGANSFWLVMVDWEGDQSCQR